MALKLSIFTTTTNAQRRGDLYHQALECYRELADEVVVVNGGGQLTEKHGVKYVNHKWPQEFEWPLIGKQFTRGYNACTGSAVIHADLDFIFHQRDFEAIRQAAQRMLDEKLPALSFWKYQFVLPDRYNLKSRLVIMVNKRDYGNKIKFDASGDLAQPSLSSEYLSPNTIQEARIPFYCYEKLLKTKEQIADDQGRMERAWFRHFGEYQMGSDGTDESALDRWLKAQYGKLQKPQEHVKLEDHPKYVQETIKNLKPEQFGYSGFGKELNDYVKN